MNYLSLRIYGKIIGVIYGINSEERKGGWLSQSSNQERFLSTFLTLRPGDSAFFKGHSVYRLSFLGYVFALGMLLWVAFHVYVLLI